LVKWAREKVRLRARFSFALSIEDRVYFGKIVGERLTHSAASKWQDLFCLNRDGLGQMAMAIIDETEARKVKTRLPQSSRMKRLRRAYGSGYGR
jgi:hypothetical protein